MEEEKEPDSKEKNQNGEKEARVPLQLPPGTIVKNRWKLTAKIGQGAFGETYSGYDLNSPDGQQVAIKVERWDNKKMVLKLEVMALKKLQLCPYVVKYVSSGRQDDFNFLVMERLGDNLAELRKKTSCGAFSMGTTLRLGMQMLEAIEGCHNLSYIHRDIKPSNFVIGKTEAKRRRCFLIDFGLARKYRMPGGEIRPARKSAGFRGTARYASVHSHESKELSRRDDLWSLFYVLVEFASGSLPWRKIKDKDQIGELKAKYTNQDLVKDLPSAFGLFLEHLQSLGYQSSPDYSYLRSLLQTVLDAEGVVVDTPYDWELSDSFARSSIASNQGAVAIADVPMVAREKIIPGDHVSEPHPEEGPGSIEKQSSRMSGGLKQQQGRSKPEFVEGREAHVKAENEAVQHTQPTSMMSKFTDAERPAASMGISVQIPINASAAAKSQAEVPDAKEPKDVEPSPPVGQKSSSVSGVEVADTKGQQPTTADTAQGKAGKNVDSKGANKGCRCTIM
eukprot:GGOE01001468.1.p1 GENE.GGOE01001468.1~~GGOE01001468.1.p1  ORF type:complete len:506 (-),score=68.77 GGOE01001468.1:353-1870(-)